MRTGHQSGQNSKATVLWKTGHGKPGILKTLDATMNSECIFVRIFTKKNGRKQIHLTNRH
jgi:hypothetical protein